MKRRLESGDDAPSRAIPRAQRQVGSLDLSAVAAAVAKEYGLDEEELATTWRRGDEEAVAVYLSRRLTGATGVAIGKRYGVSSARVSQLLREIEGTGDAKRKGRVERLEKRLRRGS